MLPAPWFVTTPPALSRTPKPLAASPLMRPALTTVPAKPVSSNAAVTALVLVKVPWLSTDHGRADAVTAVPALFETLPVLVIVALPVAGQPPPHSVSRSWLVVWVVLIVTWARAATGSSTPASSGATPVISAARQTLRPKVSPVSRIPVLHNLSQTRSVFGAAPVNRLERVRHTV